MTIKRKYTCSNLLLCNYSIGFGGSKMRPSMQLCLKRTFYFDPSTRLFWGIENLVTSLPIAEPSIYRKVRESEQYVLNFDGCESLKPILPNAYRLFSWVSFIFKSGLTCVLFDDNHEDDVLFLKTFSSVIEFVCLDKDRVRFGALYNRSAEFPALIELLSLSRLSTYENS